MATQASAQLFKALGRNAFQPFPETPVERRALGPFGDVVRGRLLRVLHSGTSRAMLTSAQTLTGTFAP